MIFVLTKNNYSKNHSYEITFNTPIYMAYAIGNAFSTEPKSRKIWSVLTDGKDTKRRSNVVVNYKN